MRIFSWQWVDVVELSMSRRHHYHSCLRGRRKWIHLIASSLSTTRLYLTTLTAGNFQANYLAICWKFSESNILNFKILISQCNCNFLCHLDGNWWLNQDPESDWSWTCSTWHTLVLQDALETIWKSIQVFFAKIWEFPDTPSTLQTIQFKR